MGKLLEGFKILCTVFDRFGKKGEKLFKGEYLLRKYGIRTYSRFLFEVIGLAKLKVRKSHKEIVVSSIPPKKRHLC